MFFTTTAAINLLDFFQLSFAKFYIGIYNLKTWFKKNTAFSLGLMISENFKLSLQYSSATSIPLLLKNQSFTYHLLIITEDDSTTLIEFAFNKTSFSAKSNSSVSIVGIIRDILLSQNLIMDSFT
jgi:hypothetical protein